MGRSVVGREEADTGKAIACEFVLSDVFEVVEGTTITGFEIAGFGNVSSSLDFDDGGFGSLRAISIYIYIYVIIKGYSKLGDSIGKNGGNR